MHSLLLIAWYMMMAGLLAFMLVKRKRKARQANAQGGNKDMDELMHYRSPVPTSATTTPVMSETPRPFVPNPYEHQQQDPYYQQQKQQQQQQYYYSTAPQQQEPQGYAYDTTGYGDNRMLTAAYMVDQQPPPGQDGTTATTTPCSVYRTPSYNYQQPQPPQPQQQQHYMAGPPHPGDYGAPPHPGDYGAAVPPTNNYYQPYPPPHPDLQQQQTYYTPHLMQTDVPHSKD